MPGLESSPPPEPRRFVPAEQLRNFNALQRELSAMAFPDAAPADAMMAWVEQGYGAALRDLFETGDIPIDLAPSDLRALLQKVRAFKRPLH